MCFSYAGKHRTSRDKELILQKSTKRFCKTAFFSAENEKCIKVYKNIMKKHGEAPLNRWSRQP